MCVCVYTHTCTCSSVYLGLTLNPIMRWARPRPLAFTLYCQCQYCVVYMTTTGGRGETLYCAIVWATTGGLGV